MTAFGLVRARQPAGRKRSDVQRIPAAHRYAQRVAEDDPAPTRVLTREAVRWGIDTLGAQRLHPTFVMYLYLRKQHRAGLLGQASASSDELLALIKMPGHPTKPYYFPLIDRGKRAGKPLTSFWRASNIPGSWSPGSIRRQPAGGWLGASDSAYAMPADHAALARQMMLYDRPVSALAMAAYFMRNDGFHISGEPTAQDVLAGFKSKFDYTSDADAEFAQLFITETPEVAFAWFEPFERRIPASEEPIDA